MPRAATVDLDSLFARIEQLVQQHGAVPRSELRAFKRHLPALRDRLAAAGFETEGTVREPLAQQLSALLEEGPVRVQGLDKKLAGATAKDTKAAVEKLLAAGKAQLVMRESGPSLARVSETGLPSAELTDLLRRLTAAQRLIRAAKAKQRTTPGATVLAGDLQELLSAITQRGAPASTAPALQALAVTIARHVAGSALPRRIPDVVRQLGLDSATAKDALRWGARAGLFALQPESGLGRLSADDTQLCPAGPEGTVLSWIVPVSAASADQTKEGR